MRIVFTSHYLASYHTLHLRSLRLHIPSFHSLSCRILS